MITVTPSADFRPQNVASLSPPRPDAGRLQRGREPCAGDALPPVNEGVTLIKDSPLVSTIGLAELTLAKRLEAPVHLRGR